MLLQFNHVIDPVFISKHSKSFLLFELQQWIFVVNYFSENKVSIGVSTGAKFVRDFGVFFKKVFRRHFTLLYTNAANNVSWVILDQNLRQNNYYSVHTAPRSSELNLLSSALRLTKLALRFLVTITNSLDFIVFG